MMRNTAIACLWLARMWSAPEAWDYGLRVGTFISLSASRSGRRIRRCRSEGPPRLPQTPRGGSSNSRLSAGRRAEGEGGCLASLLAAAECAEQTCDQDGKVKLAANDFEHRHASRQFAARQEIAVA